MTYRLVLLLMFFQLSFVLYAQEVTEVTLKSDKGKEVSITYSIKRNGTNADVVFYNSYVDNNKQGLVLLFSTSRACDRIKKRSTLKLDSIIESIPYKIEQLNKDPLHIIRNRSSIRISQLNKDEDYLIHLPIYLAKSDHKKEKYDLIDLCHLRINIPPVDTKVEEPKSTSRTERESHPQNENLQVNDIDGYDDLENEDPDWNQQQANELENNRSNINNIINAASKRVSKACCYINGSEFPSQGDIDDIIGYLKNDKDKIEGIDESNPMLDSIDDAIKKLNSLKEKQAKTESDSIAAMAKQEAEAAQQRNMWLIIGGIILAILGFVGNQVFQHVRNARNQRNMMSMQQSMVQRAENEAKRRAQSMARQKVNQFQNAARRKSQDYVRGNINSGISKISKGKKNKGFSI